MKLVILQWTLALMALGIVGWSFTPVKPDVQVKPPVPVKVAFWKHLKSPVARAYFEITTRDFGAVIIPEPMLAGHQEVAPACIRAIDGWKNPFDVQLARKHKS